MDRIAYTRLQNVGPHTALEPAFVSRIAERLVGREPTAAEHDRFALRDLKNAAIRIDQLNWTRDLVRAVVANFDLNSIVLGMTISHS